MDYYLRNFREFPELTEHNMRMARIVWPTFMLHDSVSDKYFMSLYEYFPEYQFALFDKESDELIALANCLPLFWDKPFSELPEEGWDWVLKQGVLDFQNKIKPNIASAIQIMIPPAYRGQGVSSLAVKEMVRISSQNGLSHLIAPVRPNMKHLYPLLSIDDYITWRDENDDPYDPWLRVHYRLGGQIIKPCHKAMLIEGTVDEWEEWTDMLLLQSGIYPIPGALSPIEIDIENNKGRYIEPNVWMVHKVADVSANN